MSKINVLIAGATGYIGVQLIKILNIIALIIRDIIVLNVASEKPNRVKVTSLQLTVFFSSAFKRS